MSQLRGYRTGGTVHIVINNQVELHRGPRVLAFLPYATDVARMIEAPIFHVNGDDPEVSWRVARLAFEFRRAFNKDVVIDLICYRRRGHNESDNPAFHPAADVRPDRQEALGAQALHRVPDRSRRHHPGRGRAGPPGTTRASWRRSSPRSARLRPSRPPGTSRRPRTASRSRSRTAVSTEVVKADRRVPGQHPRPHHRPPASPAAAAAPGGDGRGRHDRLGHGQRPWPSAPCCWRAPPVRLAGQDSQRGTFGQRHAVT